MSQVTDILKFMREHGSITTMDAFNMGITRLASRVHELRKYGFSIISTHETALNRHGKTVRFVRYRLAGKA